MHDDPVDAVDHTGYDAVDAMTRYMPALAAWQRAQPLSPWEQAHPKLAMTLYVGSPFALAGGGIAASSEAVGEGAAVLGGALKDGRVLWTGLKLLSGGITDYGEANKASVGEKAIAELSSEEKAEAIASSLESGVEAGIDEGKLAGQAAVKAGEKIVNSIAGAIGLAKGYDSVKANSNGTVTAKSTQIGSRIPVTTTCGQGGCTSN